MSRVLIGYDIHESRRRRRTLKSLRKLTACYQNSFFECDLTESALQAIYEELTDDLEPNEDGLIVAFVAQGHMNALGQRWTKGGQGLYLVA